MTTIQDRITQVVQQKESECLDFKQEMYDFSIKKKIADFVKDIAAMANTPRVESALIVIGVEAPLNGANILHGIDYRPDDVQIQQYLDNYLQPVPRCSYHQIEIEGKFLGVIEIHPDRVGPVQIKKAMMAESPSGDSLDSKFLLFEKQFLTRRVSKNTVASPEDIQRIVAWIQGKSVTQPQGALGGGRPWNELLELTESFSVNRQFVLVSAGGVRSGAKISGLGRLPWSAVFDFDVESESTGLLSIVRNEVEVHRSVHLVTKGDRFTFNRNQSCYWFFPMGLAGRPSTITDQQYRGWFQAVGRDLSSSIKGISSVLRPMPVTCVLVEGEDCYSRHANKIVETLCEELGDSVSIVCLGDRDSRFFEHVRELAPSFIAMTLPELAQGLVGFFDRSSIMGDGEVEILMPNRTGMPTAIPEKTRLWLEESLELLHTRVGRIYDGVDGDIGRGFLRGRLISWYELEMRYDVERDMQESIVDRIRNMLSANRSWRFNLYHAPGSGGTTLVRRIAWAIRRSSPVVRVFSNSVQEVVERVEDLYRILACSIMLLIEGSEVSGHAIDGIVEQLRQRNVPAVVVAVLRRTTSQHMTENARFLQSELSDDEMNRFIATLGRDVPARKSHLERLAQSREPAERTAFYLGLTAYLEEFAGIKPYISARLNLCNDSERAILCLISLCYVYSQRGVSSQMFADILGVSPGRVVNLHRVLPRAAIDLTIAEQDGTVRPLHDVVAKFVVQSILSPGQNDSRVWKQRLSDWAVRLAELLSRGGDKELETVERLFLFRDNDDWMGTERSYQRKYAHLIEDISSRDGRKHVLQNLCNLFSDRAHFWGHLGRYCSFELGEFEFGIDCLDRALSIEPESGVLHHMKGMIFRRRVMDGLERRVDLKKVLEDALNAVTAFTRSRELTPDREHGIISEVEMRCSIIDYVMQQSAQSFAAYATSDAAIPFVRESGAECEGLLEQLSFIRGNREASKYEVDCRAKLSRIYQDNDVAINAWSELLRRPGVFRPPVRRQLIWTYLARQGGSWSALKQKHVRKISQLIQENLDEESGNDRDLRIWIRCARLLEPAESLESIIERVGYWRENSGGVIAWYYYFVLKSLQAINGSRLALDEAEKSLSELRLRTRNLKNNRISFEWLGELDGIRALVHQSELGQWNPVENFWEDGRLLRRAQGRIVSVSGGDRGEIEMGAGLRVFFSPGSSGVRHGRDENRRVTFCLGFAYDGPRAWSVKLE